VVGAEGGRVNPGSYTSLTRGDAVRPYSPQQCDEPDYEPNRASRLRANWASHPAKRCLHGPQRDVFMQDDAQTPTGAASPIGQPSPERTLYAVLLLILAVSLFSCLDTVAKLLVTRHAIPLAQVVWLRFVGQSHYMIALYHALSLPSLLATSKFKLQLIRSILMVTTTAGNFYALQTLRLDQTVTITFLAPLVVAALAGPLLGEWIGWRRAVAIVVGFGGVLIALHPGSAPLSLAVIASLTGMLAYALFMLLTRYLAAYDPPLVTLFYSMLAGTVLMAPIALYGWVQPHDTTTWLLLAALGALGGTGHWLFILAYRAAPASRISPFLYVQLLTMTLAGYLVFGDTPDANTLIGAAVVIASGVYLVHRERITAQMARNSALAQSSPTIA